MIPLLQPEPAPVPVQPSWALWRLGFRPFYLLAACFALLAIPLWLWLYPRGGTVGPLPGMLWHAHEMLFGYATAVIAGFLLTAVRNWTGLPTPDGWRLAGLVMLWLAARLLLPVAPLALVALVDLAFLPALAMTLRRRLLQSQNRRNLFVPRLLLLLTLCDLWFWLAAAGLAGDARLPLQGALSLITVLEVVIAGRVVPMFTRNALPGTRQFRLEWLERSIAPATLAVLAANLVWPDAGWLAVPDLALAALHLVRLAGWGPARTWRNPLLWILHLSYLWLAGAFLLAALASLHRVPWSAAIHLLAVGALGGLTMGMITRTALGHSGRMLIAGRHETGAYLAMALAAVLRVLPLVIVVPGSYYGWLFATGLCWFSSFILYLLKYAPVLNQARIDGKPG